MNLIRSILYFASFFAVISIILSSGLVFFNIDYQMGIFQNVVVRKSVGYLIVLLIPFSINLIKNKPIFKIEMEKNIVHSAIGLFIIGLIDLLTVQNHTLLAVWFVVVFTLILTNK